MTMGYPEQQSIVLHLDPVSKIVYVNAEPKLIPKSAAKCRASFDSLADRTNFLSALSHGYTIYMSDDNSLAADIGLTTFTRRPRTGMAQIKKQ
ncbi:hypothetical protein LLG95_16145 [bacterium]|nr:hypothetical protein [bacterium]